MNKLLAVILFSAVMGCSNSRDASDSSASYVQEAESRFGSAYTCEPNTTDRFILCSHRPDTTVMNPLPKVAFFVYDTKENAVMLEEAEFAGDVSWVDEFEIEMTITPGIVRDDGSGKPKYKIDVRSGNRRKVGGQAPIPN